MAEQKKLAPLDEDWKRALAVVAHPDDLEYGAASAVARRTSQGKHVGYLLATRGEAGIDTMPPTKAGALREQEERTRASPPCKRIAPISRTSQEILNLILS